MAMGIPALRILAASFLFAGVSIILGAAFPGPGRAHVQPDHLPAAAARHRPARVPPTGFYRPGAGVVVRPLAEGVSCLVALAFYRKIYREKISVLECGGTEN